MNNERRRKARFAIERSVRYKTADNGVVLSTGEGRTTNMCSGGVAFRAEQPLKTGVLVELSISWPALLEQTCPMRFVVYGRILRSEGCEAVCSIEKHEFRTQARSFQAAVPARADGVLQRWAYEMHRENLKVHTVGA